MITCPECGSQYPEDHIFCGKCGTPLRKACPACGCPAALAQTRCERCDLDFPAAARDDAEHPPEARPVSFGDRLILEANRDKAHFARHAPTLDRKAIEELFAPPPDDKTEP
ncbi:MAG: zinc ribbon domain-containing protein [Kiritimatiellae bacterium]|nr:zinc ribbon domain-containing protein [Kiritimatiellia bacterium]